MSTKSIAIDGSYKHTLYAPKCWEFLPLKELVEIIGGSQPPKSDFSSEPGLGKIRLIQIRDYKSEDYVVYIPVEKAKRFCVKDDIMIGRYGPPIFQILRGLDGAYNVALMKAEPKYSFLEKEYLYRYLRNQNIYNYVESASDRTAGQSGVNKKHLENYPIPLPPQTEQKQIITRLDELLRRVNCIKSSLDAIPNILKRFHQSVLKNAVTGELTNEWRTTNKIVTKSAPLLLERILEERQVKWKEQQLKEFKTKGNLPKTDNWKKKYKEPELDLVKGKIDVPSEWLTSSLSTLTTKVKRGPSLKCNQEGKGIRYITSGNLESGKVRLDYDQKYLENFDGIEKCRLMHGDLILNCVNSLEQIGKSAVFEEKYGNAIVGFNNYALELLSDFYNPYFANICAQSMPFRTQLYFLIKRAVNQVSFASKELGLIEIPIPSIEEQIEIVRRVELFFAFSDLIEQHVKEAQSRVNNLTQSILAKAFRGELTADWREQNHDLISGENSAQVLLDKIKTEIEKLKPKSKKARKKANGK